MFDSVCYLCQETITKDSALNEIKTYTGRKVFVRRTRSITRNEFYEASAQGLQPEAVLVMFFKDYWGEKVVRWGGVDYVVTRTYQKPDSDDLEVTIERRLEPLEVII